eukprot:Gb_39376 [translate_table: standard]
MEDCQDFLERLDVDMARNVLRYLDAPADLAHFAAVSRSWRKFVVESGCSKELCIRMFPEVSRFDCVIEMGKPMHSEGASSSKGIEWKNLEREHRVYTQLARNLMAPPADKGCIQQPISASSTDNFPDESIMYTLDPRPIEDDRPSYWSSEGKGNTEVPETLTYKLSSKLCMVHEVRIRPFQAYFQMGLPIYSAKAVRFRLGRSRSSLVLTSRMGDVLMSNDRSASEDYVWTYISPEFPMQQEDRLQTFKLPRPVLCIGGILQIELLGRVQKQEMDGLYYICVCHAQVVGRPLSPAFDFELDPREQYILKYSNKLERCDSLSEDSSRGSSEEDEASGPSGWHAFAERIRQIRAGRVLLWNRSILNTLLGNIAVANLMLPDDQESDEENDDDVLYE